MAGYKVWGVQGKMQTTLLKDEFQDGDNRVLTQALGRLITAGLSNAEGTDEPAPLEEGPCELHVWHTHTARMPHDYLLLTLSFWIYVIVFIGPQGAEI